MTRPLCYIAAPYGAPTPEGVAWNVARAVLLAVECEVWGQGCASRAVTWANLEPLMTHAGLGSEWAALCAPTEDSAHGN